MTKKMLVDATHPEETRVVVLDGHRLEEFDFETASKKQLKGNIYLAKVTRVEPSLQAAFVEYGGNRHGFLAFSEIHPDYYRIPVADREALMAAQEAEAQQAEDEADEESGDEQPSSDRRRRRGRGREQRRSVEEGPSEAVATADGGSAEAPAEGEPAAAEPGEAEHAAAEHALDVVRGQEGGAEEARSEEPHREAEPEAEPVTPVETLGGDEVEEERVRRAPSRNYRNYKIQEVIKRRQIMLVQVTKEERGNKGAALTTFLSLAGRYCVLMPNTPRGGGISRKIQNPKDRKKMKAIMEDLDVPEGMAVILRTAGLERTKLEIRRDLDYLLRLWDSIRETTLQSSAPTLIHEEANLIKRAIRDLYSKDIEEVVVAGEEGYRSAKDFMRMLMPSHAKKVQIYRDDPVPLFHRNQVEGQIDAMHSPVVQLRSGGYIVINPTEALVSIDVNSGRATRERNIEETAYKTNLEAADEVARQLRLRDLAGLIVVDFIDMEEERHNAAVERRLKDAMRQDRARIQIGRISAFGLLELSRQRLRPSLLETHFETCVHCGGMGMTRTTGSGALSVLRAIEEEGIKRRASEITVYVAGSLALYLLNQKRDAVADIERRYGLRVMIDADDTLLPPALRIDRTRAWTPELSGGVPAVDTTRLMAETDAAFADVVEEEEPEVEETEEVAIEHTGGGRDGDGRGREGRGRDRHQRDGRRGRDRDHGPRDGQREPQAADGEAEAADGAEAPEQQEGAPAPARDEHGDSQGRRRRRRRRRRGGGSDENRQGGFAQQPAFDAAEGTDDDLTGDGDAHEDERPEAAIESGGVVTDAPVPESVAAEPFGAETFAADAFGADIRDADDRELAAAVEPEIVRSETGVVDDTDEKRHRRGRRGGRRRGREDEAPALVDAAVAEAAVAEAPAAEGAPAEAGAVEAGVTEAPAPDAPPAEAPAAEAAEPAPKPKKPRAPRRKKVAADTAVAETPPVEAALEPAPVAPEAPAPEAAPAAEQPLAVEPGPGERASETVAAEPQAPEAAAEPRAPEAAPAPANDIVPAAAAHEVVNRPPEKPRGGWWRRG